MKNVLTEEQVRMLLEVLPGQHQEGIITVALLTGMRRDELLQLQWQDIDLEKREIHIHHLKAKHEYRIIHYSDRIAEMMKRHRLNQVQRQSEVGLAWNTLDLVFPDHAGGFLRPDHLHHAWHELLQHAGLPSLSFHDMRVARAQALSTRLQTTEAERDCTHVGYLDLDKDTYPA